MDWSNFLGGFVIGITVAFIFDVIRGHLASRPSKKDMTVSDVVGMLQAMEVKPFFVDAEDDDKNVSEMDNDQSPVAPEEEDHRV